MAVRTVETIFTNEGVRRRLLSSHTRCYVAGVFVSPTSHVTTAMSRSSSPLGIWANPSCSARSTQKSTEMEGEAHRFAQ